MPHLLLEYSANVPNVPPLPALFAELHAALAETEALAKADLKSRAVRHDEFLVGQPAEGLAFVALTLKLLTGRDVSVRQRLLQVCARVLTRHFAAAKASGRCQVSVEICEMERSTYTKQWLDEAATKLSC